MITKGLLLYTDLRRIKWQCNSPILLYYTLLGLLKKVETHQIWNPHAVYWRYKEKTRNASLVLDNPVMHYKGFYIQQTPRSDTIHYFTKQRKAGMYRTGYSQHLVFHLQGYVQVKLHSYMIPLAHILFNILLGVCCSAVFLSCLKLCFLLLFS